jgi:hypothetical protein
MSTIRPRRGKANDIRGAMERMLTGRPIHTDGTLDVSTLAVEAGVSRQDLYRAYRPILEEFRSHLRRLDAAGSGDTRRDERVTRLAQQLDEALDRAARYRSERDAARRERDINASQVCHLAEQTRALRDEFDAGQKVTPIRPG